MKKVYLLLVLGILLAVSLIVGMSYAYWSNTHSQSGENFVESKCFSTSFSDVDGTEINLTNSYPMVDVDGMKTKPYEFTITNTCDTYASYNINLDILSSTTLETSLLKVALGNVTPSIVVDHELTNNCLIPFGILDLKKNIPYFFNYTSKPTSLDLVDCIEEFYVEQYLNSDINKLMIFLDNFSIIETS